MSGEISPAGRPPLSHELYGAGRVIGNKCFEENLQYLKCRAQDAHPAKCAAEGEVVHKCVYDLFKEISGKAPEEFKKLTKCLDYGDLTMSFCRKEQEAFERKFYAS
eukprot:396910-Pleurochrysis_carterae.AAC.3